MTLNPTAKNGIIKLLKLYKKEVFIHKPIGINYYTHQEIFSLKVIMLPIKFIPLFGVVGSKKKKLILLKLLEN